MYRVTIGKFNDVVISYSGSDGGFEIRGDKSHFEICSVSKNGAQTYGSAFKTLLAAIRCGLEDILSLDKGYVDWLFNSGQEHSDASYNSWVKKQSTTVSINKKDKMELEYILYELGHDEFNEFTKNKYRSQRRHQNRIIRKNNIKRIKAENYEGPDKPDSMCCGIPPTYKRIMRKRRRAAEMQATRNGKEIFFKKEDGYNWY